ncbi:MAG TPA: M1 family metallopeptidase [Chitinophaga sp.]|uniref:M1 family metallopeptidase n=1 Tax=Chitinophaga sp. TaxID=1869181 RepID=UPI002B789BC6|nr:M1 family metallopeptidase [Chitinophaga sp.]HVI46422.1 M1 family metallopeptidase [Chitinophaga sp.]
MTKLFSGLLLGGMLFLLQASAQELYMPRNITKAYEKGARDKSGKPGRNYWQNKGNYDIQVTVNPPSHTVYGEETIRYTNNSPDTLKHIVMRLILNVHKPEAVRAGYAESDFLTDGILIDTLIINGTPVAFNNKKASTATSVKLPAPLLSKETIQLQVRWHYNLATGEGREGVIDSASFFLAYYYPRISVYDDYNGWDELEHNQRLEFYSDFNDYKVAVKVPANYVVWGAGVLQNGPEVLQPAFAERLRTSYTSDEVLHIATAEDMRGRKVTKQQDWNTWKFVANDIADVTLGVSNHYVWDAASVIVDSSTMRRASVQAAYSGTAADFRHSVAFARNALGWFSHNWPGVPYPFPVMTAFQGYADMEYPMMVNDGSVGDNLVFAQLVQDHEIAHTWFPFYMGINETRYAFMDEGWATTFEYLIGVARGKATADKIYKAFRVKGYINDPSTEEDQPVISLSSQVNGLGYGHNSYGKASLAYLALKDMLGDALFRKCLHAYMDNWHGKHPMPWDFFFSFNTAAGQNLDWYWKSWFFSNNYIDLELTDVQIKNRQAALKIKNAGGFAIPFDVVVTYTDGSVTTTHHTPAVWKNNGRDITLDVPATKTVASVTLEGNLYMDATPANNTWKKS